MSQNTSNLLPKHIAIIMDGNGRWAEHRGKPRTAGHEEGVKAIEKLLNAVIKKKISILTLFVFGVENWKRPKEEVSLLMSLFSQSIRDQAGHLIKNNIKLRVIGDLTPIEDSLQEKIREVEALTINNTALTLVMAFNYSGQWDILQATKKIARKVVAGELNLEDVSDKIFTSCLSTCDLPEPDLFIRTSGEQRISNFLLWQLAYTELYFTDVLWPDFNELVLDAALDAYSKRHRRYGLTSQQLEKCG